MDIDQSVIDKAKTWLSEIYDEGTRREVSQLLEADTDEKKNNLIDSFYQDVEFGTGGIRGIMGVGSNRINSYTLSKVTQGLANYANKNFKSAQGGLKVAITYDTRNNSQFFAKLVGKIFLANGIEAWVFPEASPTPVLSFAVRYLKCQLGIVISASHNPKEYNGYKVYFADGAQIVPPWDKMIIEEVNQVIDYSQVKDTSNIGELFWIGKDVDDAYQAEILKNSNLDLVKEFADTPIIYTPLHGTGNRFIPSSLKQLGCQQIKVVKEQSKPDGDFPTVTYPNPEEGEALSLGLKEMDRHDSDLLMATDPDADRIGIAVRNNQGEKILLTGHQIGLLIADYILLKKKQQNQLPQNGYLVRSIVTTPLLDKICKKYEMNIYTVLTGFKYIGEVIRQQEGLKEFVFGMEESYGYLINDAVRDKDAVSAAVIIAEMHAYFTKNHSSFYQHLQGLYKEYGFYMDKMISIVKKGKKGKEEINSIIENYRKQPMKEILGEQVIAFRDYLKSEEIIAGKVKAIDLPLSNVLQFETDSITVTLRPSGTEPKIKFYLSLSEDTQGGVDLEKIKEFTKNKMNKLVDFCNQGLKL